MIRCTRLPALLRPALAAVLALCGAGLLPVGTALAQVHGDLGGTRTFPDQAKRGTLAILSTVNAEIDGKPVRMAPGMRLLSPQNSLVMLHTVIGKQFVVNFRIEPSTGMLHTAWILNKTEIALPRPGTGEPQNFRFESDAVPR